MEFSVLDFFRLSDDLIETDEQQKSSGRTADDSAKVLEKSTSRKRIMAKNRVK